MRVRRARHSRPGGAVAMRDLTPTPVRSHVQVAKSQGLIPRSYTPHPIALMRSPNTFVNCSSVSRSHLC